MKQLKIQQSVYFICGSCGNVGYIRQGAFSGETVVREFLICLDWQASALEGKQK